MTNPMAGTSIFFLTVALSFVGFIVLIPAELLEIILIYKSVEVIRGSGDCCKLCMTMALFSTARIKPHRMGTVIS